MFKVSSLISYTSLAASGELNLDCLMVGVGGDFSKVSIYYSPEVIKGIKLSTSKLLLEAAKHPEVAGVQVW